MAGWFTKIGGFLTQQEQVNPISIILGNQKSGTTAIARLLSGYAGLEVAADIPEMWTHERRFHEVPATMEAFVREHPQPFRHAIVKEPMLTFLYSPLRDLFPDASYLLVVRDPVQNIRSILDRLGLSGTAPEVSQATCEALGGWGDVLSGAVLGGDQGGYIANLAHRWVLAARVWCGDKDRVTLVRYEDFVADKAATITKIAGLSGLEQRCDITENLDTPFQKPGSNRDVPEDEFFSREHLDLICRICRPEMQELGYVK